ncbi:hypothetical protein K493DRAFT_317271 [Basidiobolus meristosporus CBS 931.73]|uniref:Pentacotripeptide-repeat region of PRORP domain-containing protein n=1 Tax=Basidiobolus meristosporus CBS 931.73 TaxID=1314790 RepID=A0A1Y1Y1D7_9FUNG|nr:hypothetical protein K493DRAFT_317271 [Basidiobolus meristosporus CBS 931.73]|eukprot:ORX91444.1 hypothetical protein K493DRAFT_317271 [Basidiobolus meristosporus CBS 931.73]
MLLEQGKGVDIHQSLIQQDMPTNPAMLDTMLDVFSKHGMHPQAVDILNSMLASNSTPSPERCSKFLQELCKTSDVQQVTRVLEAMENKNVALSNDTYLRIFKRCLADPTSLERNSEIYQKMARQGIKVEAQDVERMISQCSRLPTTGQTIELYGAIAAQKIPLSPEAQQTIAAVLSSSGRSTAEYRTLIINSSKKREFKQAIELFEEMVSKNVQPDQYIYTMAMNCYSHCGNGEKVLELWKIVRGLALPQKAKNISVSILLDSCGLNSSFDTLQRTWEALRASKFPLDENNFTSYIEALCKHGKYAEARRVFQEEIEEAGLQLSYKTCETVITQFKMSKHRHEFHKLFNYIQAKHPEYFALKL